MKKTTTLLTIIASTMIGTAYGQDSEYKKGASAAIEAAEHSLRAQKAVGNANAIAAAETALSTVKSAAKNDADIGKRREATSAASSAYAAASRILAAYDQARAENTRLAGGGYPVEEAARRTPAVIAANAKKDEAYKKSEKVAEECYPIISQINPYAFFSYKNETERQEKERKSAAIEAEREAAKAKRDAAREEYNKVKEEAEAIYKAAQKAIKDAAEAKVKAAKATLPAGAEDAARAARAAQNATEEAYKSVATAKTTENARQYAFEAKQEADLTVAKARQK